MASPLVMVVLQRWRIRHLPRQPACGAASAVSKELLSRLRENLKSAPADAHAKSELAQALNSLAALQATQGDLSAAKSSLEEGLALDKRNAATLSEFGDC